MTCRKVTWEKVAVEKGRGDNGSRDERSSCDRRKDEGKKGSESRCVEREVNNKDGVRKKRGKEKETTEKAAVRIFNDQVDAKWRSYSEAMIEGALRTERVFMCDSILRKTDKILNNGDVVICLPGARIEHVSERVDNRLGQGQGGSILVHVGTNNADREGTTRKVHRYRQLVGKLKKTRVE